MSSEATAQINKGPHPHACVVRTKSNVATSLATIALGWPAFGLGIRTRISVPFSICIKKTLLY